MMKRIAPGAGTRFAARAMLFLWLFSIATGWANACMLPTAGGAQAGADLHHARALPAEAGGDHGAYQGADQDAGHYPQPGLAACMSFCDVAGDGVAQGKPWDCGDAPLAQTSPGVTPDPRAVQADLARWLACTATPPPEPSRIILFLRLTI